MIREEIVRLEKETLQITFYVLTVSVAIAGIAIKDYTFVQIIPILYQITLIWGLDKFITSTRLRIKLSTYIQIFIEPKNDNLNWERRNAKFNETSRQHSSIWKFFKILSSIYTILFLLGFYVSFKFFDSTKLKDYESIIIFTSLCIMHTLTTLFLFIGVVKYPQTKYYCNKWLKVKENEKQIPVG